MAADITFLQAADDVSDTTEYTFAAQNLGAEAADRLIVVCVEGRTANPPPSLLGVTVGGVAATIVANAPIGAGSGNVAAIAVAVVPTGTTGDVVITFAATMLCCIIQLYRLAGADATPHDTAIVDTAPGTLSGTIDVPAGGSAVACSLSAGSGRTATWTALAEDYDPGTTPESLSGSSASGDFASASPGLVVTCTWSVPGDAAAFASFGRPGTPPTGPTPAAIRRYRRDQLLMVE